MQGLSITYRIAVGAQQGRKVFMLQTLLSKTSEPNESDRVAKEAGFSLLADGVARAHEHQKLARLCR